MDRYSAATALALQTAGSVLLHSGFRLGFLYVASGPPGVCERTCSDRGLWGLQPCQPPRLWCLRASKAPRLQASTPPSLQASTPPSLQASKPRSQGFLMNPWVSPINR